MTYLFDKFSKYALQNKDNKLTEVFNAMISQVTDEEAAFMEENFMLFLQIGESIRNADKKIISEIFS